MVFAPIHQFSNGKPWVRTSPPKFSSSFMMAQIYILTESGNWGKESWIVFTMIHKEPLLSRNAFRQAVFERDGHRCVLCGVRPEDTKEGKLDAHHILERRLFTADDEKGGYFLSNGASVCEPCHLLCEQTVISTDRVREAAGITRVIIPSYFYDDQEYEKWGNTVLPNGTRSPGPLFYDESVQKVLAQGGMLGMFTRYVKHPRLSHLPWSPGMNSDDRRIETLDRLMGAEVVVTEKMDGEQTTIYNDYLHARSIDGPHHESRNWVKNFASQWQFQLAENERICGENVFAQHSIIYGEDNPLKSYFYGFSMWQDDRILSWDEMTENFAILGIEPVPVLYRGPFSEEVIKGLYDEKKDWDTREGYVVRLASDFRLGDFKHSVAKYVRKGHVQTAKHHWRSQRVIPNHVS